MTDIRKIDPDCFDIPMRGNPFLHRNLEWYATNDNRLLGIVLLDLIDKDYSWVVLGDDGEQPGYVFLFGDASLPTQNEATKALFTEMVKYHKGMGGKK